MKTIWKFPLSLADEFTVKMPSGAKVLSAGVQEGRIHIWAEVDPDRNQVLKRFHVVGTGHPMPDPAIGKLRFIDTVHMAGGELVFHVFEVQ